MKKRIQKQTAEGKSRSQQQPNRVPAQPAPAAALPQHVKEQVAKQSFSAVLRVEEKLHHGKGMKRMKNEKRQRILNEINAIRFTVDQVHCHIFDGETSRDKERRLWNLESLLNMSFLLDRQPKFLREIGATVRAYVNATKTLMEFVETYQPEVIKASAEFEAKRKAAQSATAKSA